MLDDQTTPLQNWPEKISYPEYLHRSGDEWTEWVDGKVVRMTPVGKQHQQVVRFLIASLEHFVEKNEAGEVLFEPFQMKTGPDLPGRSPDVLVVRTENLSRIRATHLEGPADLVVEVVSPESGKRDRTIKFEEYQRGGVREYWCVDPGSRRAEFFEWAGGKFRPIAPREDGVFESRVLPGLWLEVEWLWPECQPNLLEVLRHWGYVP
jgi:Uma2 family endonuclease